MSATPNPEKTAGIRIGFSWTNHPASDVVNGTVDEDLALLRECAILSENCYLAPDVFTDKWDAETMRITMPEWSRVGDIPPPPDPPNGKIRIPGLHYEVWEKEREQDVLTAIVFRGTEGPDADDWKANFRWLHTIRKPLWWDQYHQTQTLIGPLTDHIIGNAERRNKRSTIIATGHSLGGGLAQQAAYASDRIKLVYAFDPSPVTGYYDIPHRKRIENRRGIKVFRIYERYEALAFFRNFMKFLYPAPYFKVKNPRLMDVRFDVMQKKGVVDQHSMRPLARAIHEFKQHNRPEPT